MKVNPLCKSSTRRRQMLEISEQVGGPAQADVPHSPLPKSKYFPRQRPTQGMQHDNAEEKMRVKGGGIKTKP